MFNEGISKSGDILDLATKFEVVTKRGAFYSYGDTRLGQGRENAKIFLMENIAILEELEQLIREAVGVSPTEFVETAVLEPEVEF